MDFPRACGILLHPTSLPSPHGIGDLGDEAIRFVDFLSAAGQRYWQILPLGPTGFGDSPYQCFSAFAGNPLLISLERLAEERLLSTESLQQASEFSKSRVDFANLIPWKFQRLEEAYQRFAAAPDHALRPEFQQFCGDRAEWLDDYALFAALKHSQGGKIWTQWPKKLARRESVALENARRDLKSEIEAQRFWQFLFFRQWDALKAYCDELGLRLIGDIPIYVAHDSADVWAHPELFLLDESGDPTVVAGVPPDYFSKTGQLWGNPIYNWDVLRDSGYAWWMKRFQATLAMVDIVRLDHFRGFEAYWEVPAGEPTAENGQWVKGPGDMIFDTLAFVLGDLPIIAENLGLITDEVEALRDQFKLPGMAVLQFAFGGEADNVHLPHNYVQNLVAYSGTHDNDTAAGWWRSGEGSTRSKKEIAREQGHARRYLNIAGAVEEPHWDFIRAIMASVAHTAIFPMQDILGLGGEGRMNQPGRSQGNWGWRCPHDVDYAAHAQRLRDLCELYGRMP